MDRWSFGYSFSLLYKNGLGALHWLSPFSFEGWKVQTFKPSNMRTASSPAEANLSAFQLGKKPFRFLIRQLLIIQRAI
jgi:hypothetical protein